PAAAAAVPAWRAETEVRRLGTFLGDALRAVRLVPFEEEGFEAEALEAEGLEAEPVADFPEEARRTPAARRAPPPVEFFDEPRDERRESLMTAPGPTRGRAGHTDPRTRGCAASQYEHEGWA